MMTPAEYDAYARGLTKKEQAAAKHAALVHFFGEERADGIEKNWGRRRGPKGSLTRAKYHLIVTEIARAGHGDALAEPIHRPAIRAALSASKPVAPIVDMIFDDAPLKAFENFLRNHMNRTDVNLWANAVLYPTPPP